MNASTRSAEQPIPKAQAIEQLAKRAPLARELRLADYKSSWSLSIEDLRIAEARAMEMLVEMNRLYDGAVISTEALAQELRSGTTEAVDHYKDIRNEIKESSALMFAAAKLFAEMGGHLNSLDESLNGELGVRARLVEGLKRQIFAKGGMLHRLDSSLNGKSGVSATLNNRLNGNEGVAAAFERRVTAANCAIAKCESRLEAAAANANKSAVGLTAATETLIKVLGDFNRKAITDLVVLSLGAVLGAVLVKFV